MREETILNFFIWETDFCFPAYIDQLLLGTTTYIPEERPATEVPSKGKKKKKKYRFPKNLNDILKKHFTIFKEEAQEEAQESPPHH